MKFDRSSDVQMPTVEGSKVLQSASGLHDYSYKGKHFGYCYCTTNSVNGKVYIGLHRKQRFNSRYLGSGTRLQLAIEKYGIEFFSVVLISWHPNLQELNLTEKNLIARYREALGVINVYNITEGGSDASLSEEMKERISRTLSGRKQPARTLAHRQALSKAGMGHSVSQSAREKMKLSAIARGGSNARGKRSEESRARMSKAATIRWSKSSV